MCSNNNKTTPSKDTAPTSTTKKDNKIGAGGTEALSEALKVNTTLTSLNLVSMQQRQDFAKQREQCQNRGKKSGNDIGIEGVGALSEALQVNMTLTALDLGSVHQQKDVKQGKENNTIQSMGTT